MTRLRTGSFVAPALVLAAAASLLASSPTLAAAAALGGETPEAVVERLRSAAGKQDFGELGACLAPEPRKEMAMGIYLGATMMLGMAQAMGGMAADLGAGMSEALGAEDEEAKKQAEKAKKEMEAKFGPWNKRYDALAKKHGLPTLGSDDASFDPEAAFSKVDAQALLADFGAFLKSFGDETGEKSPSPPVPTGKLEGLQVEGERANGTLEGEPISFVKIGGRWYIAELPNMRDKTEAPEGE